MKTKRVTLKMKAEVSGRPLTHSDLAIVEMQEAASIERCDSPESSNVVEAKFNSAKQELKVKFKSGYYLYETWTDGEWVSYVNAPSKGAFMNAKRGGFNGPKHKTTAITAEQYEAD